MSKEQRYQDASLNFAIVEAERAASEALRAAQIAYPAGAQCVVRNQRFGYAPTERIAVIESASISVSMSGGKPHSYVEVCTRNLSTGKVRSYYPSHHVDGIPSVRLLENAGHE